MSKIKQTICIFKLQTEECFHSPKYIIALILQVVQVVYYTLKYRDYALNMGEPVNIFDGYFCATSSVYTLTIMFTIYFFAISDTPFINRITYQELLRTDREEWAVGKLGFLLLTAVLTQIVAVITSAVILLPNAFDSNVWSFPFFQLSVNHGAIGQSLEYTGVDLLYHFNPFQVACLQLLLNSLFLASQGMLLFLLSLFVNKVLAFSMVVAVHIIGFFMNGYGHIQVLPFPHSVISSMYSEGTNGCGIMTSIVYLSTLMLITGFIAVLMIDRSEIGMITVSTEE